MDEDLKHIDELFKQSMEGAEITPPQGVFEQCMQQLDTVANTDANLLNKASSSVSSTSTVKGVLGLSWKAAAFVIGGVSVVVAVAMMVISNQDNLGIASNIKSNVEMAKGSQQKQVELDVADARIVQDNEIEDDGNVKSGVNNSTAAEVLLGGAVVERKEFTDVSIIPLLGKDFAIKTKTKGEIENSLVPFTEQDTKTIGKKVPICNNHRANWKPVIAENLGGIVSLDLDGKFGNVRIDWGDGLSPQMVDNRLGLTRVSHQYLVERNQSFRVKLINSEMERGQDGSMATCKDSQWLLIQVVSGDDVSEVFVPDVFTPNGDGLNETFYVRMPRPLFYELTIMDNKQRTVFRSSDSEEAWTGSCGSALCVDADYRVILAYKYSGDKDWKYIRKQIKLIRN